MGSRAAWEVRSWSDDHLYWSACIMTAMAGGMIACLVILLYCRSRPNYSTMQTMKKRARPPPSPMALPVIGHLHLIGPVPHRSLHKLAQSYGPIMLLRLGCRPTLVISSPALAKEVLHAQDHLFAHRPRTHFCDLVFYRSQGAVFMELNPRWKSLRKLYAQHIVSPLSIAASKSIRREETRSLLQHLHSLPPAGCLVDLRSIIFRWMLNVMTRVLFSERADDCTQYMLDFPDVFRELSEIFTQPMLADFVPYLHPFFDPGGLEKRLLHEHARMDAIMESIVSKRLAQVTSDPSSTPSDVLTTLLEFEGKIPAAPDGQPWPESQGKLAEASDNNDVVKALLLEMLAATTDTTTAAVEWAMAELLGSRGGALERLRQEIAEAMEAEESSQVDEAVLANLPYLEAVLKEALRLHPPASLLLPHFAKEATQVAGYDVPANTILAVNAWAIGRDESVWEDAHLFKPERFLAGGSDCHISFSGQTDYQLLGFGKGRRGCPGRSLGLIMAGLVVANLVHNFDWRTSTPPDLTEKMSAANVLAHPLLPTLSPRHT